MFQKLPDGFKFSQSSLQDYVDCPRRFQLRYVESRVWPSVQVEPMLEYERHLERGAEFHRLVERHQLGMDETLLTARIGDPDLLGWWRAYLGFDFLHQLEGQRYPEYTLSVRLNDVVLAATFDLLVVGERVVIFDWKTYSDRPSLLWFESRLQTRVYPFVLCASNFLLRLRPERVLMVYWLAGMPDSPVFLEYDSLRFERDRVYLGGLVLEVGERLRLVGETWLLTSDVARCGFCEYRSLCGRGILADSFGRDGNGLGNISLDGGGVLGLFDVEGLGFD